MKGAEEEEESYTLQLEARIEKSSKELFVLFVAKVVTYRQQ